MNYIRSTNTIETVTLINKFVYRDSSRMNVGTYDVITYNLLIYSLP